MKRPSKPFARNRYEIPYLQQQQNDLAIHRDIMQNDPMGSAIAR
jgi:hypothetical protein